MEDMMLDDLRNSAGSAFLDDDPLDPEPTENVIKPRRESFLGMTAPQRFVVVLFLFFMIAILGVFLLIVFQKVYPPI
jgi:hypothetical protein